MKSSLLLAVAILLFAGTSHAEQTRDLIARVTTFDCDGGGHKINMRYDSAFSPYGPESLKIDGKESGPGMQMEMGSDTTTYTTKSGTKFKVDHEKAKASKDNYQMVADFRGKQVRMTCKYKSKMKLFRSREEYEWEKDEKSQTPAGKTSPKSSN